MDLLKNWEIQSLKYLIKTGFVCELPQSVKHKKQSAGQTTGIAIRFIMNFREVPEYISSWMKRTSIASNN